MITLNQRNRLLRVIQRQVRAEIEHSWKGSGDPASIEHAVQSVNAARMNTRRMIDGLVATTVAYEDLTFNEAIGYPDRGTEQEQRAYLESVTQRRCKA